MSALRPVRRRPQDQRTRPIPAGRSLVCVELPIPRPVVHAVRGILWGKVRNAGQSPAWVETASVGFFPKIMGPVLAESQAVPAYDSCLGMGPTDSQLLM